MVKKNKKKQELKNEYKIWGFPSFMDHSGMES